MIYDGFSTILHLFEHLGLPYLPHDLILRLLASPLESICFCAGARIEGVDLGTADIFPKAIAVMVATDRAYPLMVSLFHRVAQLGHLESFIVTVSSFCDRDLVPADVGRALIHAVQASQKLNRLELLCNENVWNNCLQDLLGVLETRESLRALRLHCYPTELDPQFRWLKQLL